MIQKFKKKMDKIFKKIMITKIIILMTSILIMQFFKIYLNKIKNLTLILTIIIILTIFNPKFLIMMMKKIIKLKIFKNNKCNNNKQIKKIILLKILTTC